MKKLLIILFLFWTISVQSQTTYHISNGGNDANPGTILLPWATVAKLNSSWTSINAGDVVAFQKGGKWNETITPTKSGSSGNPITITSYGSGAQPIIGGSIVISGWVTLGGNKYQSISTVSPESSINMVTFDSIPQRVSRFPDFSAANKGYLTYSAVGGSKSAGGEAWIKLAASLGFDATGKRLNIREERWSIKQVTVTRHSGDTLFYTQINGYAGKAGFGCFLEHDSTFVTSQGEWYHSPYTGKLIIYSTVNPSAITIEASTGDMGINFNSRSHFTVNGLSFIGQNKTGAIANNNNGNLYTTSTNNIILQNCYFKNEGIQAIRMDNVVNASVTNTTAAWCLGAGITINNKRSTGVNGATINYCNVNVVAPYAGMEITGDAVGRTGICGVANSGVNILYNVVDSCGYAGIEFQGSDVLVYGNIVGNCLYVRDDGGNIYTFGGRGALNIQTNRILRKNIVFNALGAIDGTNTTTSSARGIYTDEQTNHVIIDSNTVYNITSNALYGNSVKAVRISKNNVNNAAKSWFFQRIVKNNQGQVFTDSLDIVNNYFPNYSAGYSTQQIDSPFISNTTSIALDSTLARMGRVDSNFVTNLSSQPYSGITMKKDGSNYTAWAKTLTQYRALGKELHTTVLANNDYNLYINATGTDSTFTIPATEIWEDMEGNQFTGSFTISRYYSRFMRFFGYEEGGGTPLPPANNTPVRVRARFYNQ